MISGDHGAIPINSFALVTYIPGELGVFLDELRLDLVPACMPRAHVTILPPRPLSAPKELAVEELDGEIRELSSFDIEALSVDVFWKTSVIFIKLGKGAGEMTRVHNLLNKGKLFYDEPFEYHPHITLAQEILPEQVEGLRQEASRRWAAYSGPRTFTVESLTFVQNTSRNRWLDLAHWTLGAVPTAR